MAGRNNPPQRPGYAARRQREGLAYGSDVQGNAILGGTYNALEPYLGPASAAGLTQLADYTLPFYGGAATVMDGANYIKGGDYGMGAAMIGLGSLEFLPYAGKAARAVNMDGAARFLGDESGAIRAWHGSPHDFPPVRLLEMPDGTRLYQNMNELAETPAGAKVLKEYPLGRFDMNKIGTGEGAQAYGHGLYFAENADTAKAYRDRLSTFDAFGDRRPNIATVDGVPARELGQDVWEVADQMASRGMSVDEYIQDLGKKISATENPARADVFLQLKADAERVAERLRGKEVKFDGGRLYEVEIDANPEDFLDWDAPLSEQPEALQNVVRKADLSHLPAGGRLRRTIEAWRKNPGDWQPEPGANIPEPTGNQIHSALTDYGTSTPENAALTSSMREAGIPGIRYYDQGSRTAGEGTRNYVVFDDELVRIVKKYGIAGAAAMLGMSQAEVENRL